MRRPPPAAPSAPLAPPRAALACAVLGLVLLHRPLPAGPSGGAAAADLQAVGHLLNRAAYGPTPRELERVRAMGIEAWIEEQLDPESIDDSALEALAAPLFEERAGARRIKGLEELQALAHLQAIASRRQLQAVLAGFWENHFPTDFDKVAQWLDALQNSDGSDAYPTAEARREAARLEHEEYEHFRRHALGSFGDLLRHSARSPTMLVYLDNVLNMKGSANENYAREILELHCLGVDNGYVQADIEQLARCFTGWGVAKVLPGHAGDPHAPIGVRVADEVLLAPGEATPSSGKDWRYFKGASEPPAGWREADFDDSGWLQGPAGIGYGDGDDVTVLTDMQNRYSTLYLRKTFTLEDPQAVRHHLLLAVIVDDGFLAYLNGTEAARLNAPGKPGEPVPHTALATQSREAGKVPLLFNLEKLKGSLRAGKNVLALQVLNVARESSDLSMIPSLLVREVLEGSVENGDPRGVFSFHFFPDLHEGGSRKTLFKGTPFQLEVEGRGGLEGLQEAEEAIARILEHPSTAAFICSKLIQKLVGDEVDHRRPAEGPYAGLLRRSTEVWRSTSPPGDLKAVVRTILQSREFWSSGAHRAKLKDPFEFITSSVRALEARASGKLLASQLQGMGMHLFTRDEPDGWPESGSKLLDLGTFQRRLAFALSLSEGAPGASPDLHWDPRSLLGEAGPECAEEVVERLEALLFQGSLSPADRSILRDHLTSGEDGRPLPLGRDRPDLLPRLRQAVGLALSLPQWQFQ